MKDGIIIFLIAVIICLTHAYSKCWNEAQDYGYIYGTIDDYQRSINECGPYCKDREKKAWATVGVKHPELLKQVDLVNNCGAMP